MVPPRTESHGLCVLAYSYNVAVCDCVEVSADPSRAASESYNVALWSAVRWLADVLLQSLDGTAPGTPRGREDLHQYRTAQYAPMKGVVLWKNEG